jgi:ribosome-binding protein aMBF1 (putative translation factor)
MSPTRDEYLLHLNTAIEKLDRRLAGYEDRTLQGERHGPSYNRTIEQRQRLIAERDRLLRTPPANRAPGPETKEGAPTNERESVVLPILDKKGWSKNQLAVEAEVDFHTVNGYLKGKTRPNRSTRKQLADALGIAVNELPK